MKTVITYLALFCSVVVFAQKNFQGKAVYQKKTKIDVSRFENNKNIPPERKKMIIDRMKKRSNRTFILNFNKTKSIYKEEQRLETPQKTESRFMGYSGNIDYKNILDKKFLTSTEFFGKQFLITNDAKMPKWEMGTETKKIGNYTCYKASFKKENEAASFRGFEKSKNNKKLDSIAKKQPKEILVTAWYTPQIPVSTGPEKYWGLPGLILEINEGKSTILCTEVVLNPKEKITIKEPTKGDKVTRKEYKEIVTQKVREMQERFERKRGRKKRRR